jgi:tetratricopeptide (TPR) repeat protein
MYEGTEAKVGGRLIRKDESKERITKIGKILRKCKLDELPQLINVIKGEMNLVGPRPMRPALLESYLKDYPDYTKRFAVKPGITGLAQINGGYYIHPRDKLQYDFLYIQNQGFGLDCQIIATTVYLVLKKGLPKWLYRFLVKLRYGLAKLKERRIPSFVPLYLREFSGESDLAILAQQQIPKTIQQLKRLARNGYRHNSEAFYCLGLAYTMNNQQDKAVNALKQAIKLNPDYVKPYYQLGALFYRQEQYNEAINYLKRANILAPQDADILSLLGLCYAALEFPEKAKEYWAKAAAIDATYKEKRPHPKSEQVILLGNHIPIDKLIVCLKKAVVEHPESPKLHYMLGLACIHQDEIDAAIQAFSAALAIRPSYLEAKINLGSCLSKKGDCEAAIQTFETIFQEKPDDAEVQMHLGMLYAQNGDNDRAVMAFKEALRINPQLQAARIQFKLLNHQLGWASDVI